MCISGRRDRGRGPGATTKSYVNIRRGGATPPAAARTSAMCTGPPLRNTSGFRFDTDTEGNRRAMPGIPERHSGRWPKSMAGNEARALGDCGQEAGACGHVACVPATPHRARGRDRLGRGAGAGASHGTGTESQWTGPGQKRGHRPSSPHQPRHPPVLADARVDRCPKPRGP